VDNIDEVGEKHEFEVEAGSEARVEIEFESTNFVVFVKFLVKKGVGKD